MGAPKSKSAIQGRAWALLNQVSAAENNLGVPFGNRVWTRCLIKTGIEVSSPDWEGWNRQRVARMAKALRRHVKGLDT